MKLYSYWRSSCTWRVRIALALKNVPYTYEAIHLTRDGGDQNTPRYQALNPTRTVPLLELDDGRRISQSLAILEYLEERYPAPAILPADPFLRAKARQIAEAINSGIQPLQNLAVLQHVTGVLRGEDRAWAQHWIQRGLTALEPMVAETAGAFCVGDAPSLADLCLVPQLYNARRFGVELSAFPTLTRIELRCAELSAFQAAAPDRQPDAQR